MQLGHIALVAGAALASCGETQQAQGRQIGKDSAGPGGGDVVVNPTPVPPPTPTPDPLPPPDDDDHGTDPNVGYGVAELLETQAKAVERFNRRPPQPNATVEAVKSWLEPGWIWARLTYKFTAEDGTVKEEAMFIACHSHGTQLGCHRKNAPGAGEPNDDGTGGTGGGDDHDHDDDHDGDGGDDTTPPDDDLPPIDDELPPIEDEL